MLRRFLEMLGGWLGTAGEFLGMLGDACDCLEMLMAA